MNYFALLRQNSINNKYYNWYVNICQRAQTQNRQKGNDVYYERHHILPKSFKLGGEQDKMNLVHLTAREHYVAHILLSKFTVGDYRKKMVYALWYLSNRNIHTPTSRLYESTKRRYIENTKSRVDSEETRRKKAHPGELNGMHGRTHSDTVKQKLSALAKERFTGKSYEEIHGAERAAHLKQDKSKKLAEFIKNNPGVRDGKNNPNAKTYYFIDPNGEEYIVTGGLRKFCEANSLPIGSIIKVSKNRKPDYKGWKVRS